MLIFFVHRLFLIRWLLIKLREGRELHRGLGNEEDDIYREEEQRPVTHDTRCKESDSDLSKKEMSTENSLSARL